MAHSGFIGGASPSRKIPTFGVIRYVSPSQAMAIAAPSASVPTNSEAMVLPFDAAALTARKIRASADPNRLATASSNVFQTLIAPATASELAMIKSARVYDQST